jgi:hypothetical protein
MIGALVPPHCVAQTVSTDGLSAINTVDELAQLCRHYHGDAGAFVYHAFAWANPAVFGNRLPIPLFQWALTPYGHCLGLTQPWNETRPPVISYHPAIWTPSARHGTHRCQPEQDWSCRLVALAGPRYTLDVVLHELCHVDVEYVRGGCGKRAKSSHDNPIWCAAIMEASARLRGTMLEVPAFTARPTIRRRTKGARQQRVTPEGCLPMSAVSGWPHALREPGYYQSREVPFPTTP